MSYKECTNIRVAALIHTGDLSCCEKIEMVLTSNICNLSSQINEVMQKILVGARAALLKKYADNLVKKANSPELFEVEQKTAYVRVIVNCNSMLAKCFRGEEVPLTLESITKSELFTWETVEETKAKLAIEAAESFEALAK